MQDGLDDVTNEPLSKRPDDNPETFKRRLSQFYESTSPLLGYFAESSQTDPTGEQKLVTIQGKTSDEIWPKLDGFVKNAFPGLKERAETRTAKLRYGVSDTFLAHDHGILAKEDGKAMMEAWSATSER